ncbi:VOC family protein [Spirosoma validum]|uniref:VOC family protein n=1 Tax=Spirosoma validum TaxID=2771355 RepID=A0A927AZD1_9BACT|nr:VOC family protein [Spirosoma validum]MBD2752536.1 VOC family protein [Spirosoma validum]
MKLLTIELETADPVGTRKFYTQQLDLPIVAESAESLTVQVGWTQLTFRSVPGPVAPYHFAINVPSGMLELCMHWFSLNYMDTQSPGQTIAEFPDWKARSAYFLDNNGNILEFIARRDLPYIDANLTVGDLFQCISELGIVTPCVVKTSYQLSKHFGVKRFSKSKPMHDFAALGDDNGLFIVSKENRTWLFTNTPAVVNNYRVTFESEPGGPLQTLTRCELSPLVSAASIACSCPLSSRHSQVVEEMA